MEPKRILVNGACGRIGRQVSFDITQSPYLELYALNDPAIRNKQGELDLGILERSLTRRDSTHGILPWSVRPTGGNTIEINGKKVKVFAETDTDRLMSNFPEALPDIIEECSGFFGKNEKAAEFLISDKQVVVMSYAATGPNTKMLVTGVNHGEFNPALDRLVSNASCTTKALAAPLQILLDQDIEVNALLMDTVHAATNSQRILDTANDYAALNQIITAKTGAAKATGQVIPILNGIMDGMAFRVPTTDGSFANLYFVANYSGELNAERINQIFENHINHPAYMGRVAIHHEKEAASADIIGKRENGIVIASKTRVFPLPYEDSRGRRPYLVGIVSGYDNEMGPPMDQVLLTEHIAKSMQ